MFTDANCRLGVVACLSADVTDGTPEAGSGPKKKIAKKQLDGTSACSARLRGFGCSLPRMFEVILTSLPDVHLISILDDQPIISCLYYILISLYYCCLVLSQS